MVATRALAMPVPAAWLVRVCSIAVGAEPAAMDRAVTVIAAAGLATRAVELAACLEDSAQVVSSVVAATQAPVTPVAIAPTEIATQVAMPDQTAMAGDAADFWAAWEVRAALVTQAPVTPVAIAPTAVAMPATTVATAIAAAATAPDCGSTFTLAEVTAAVAAVPVVTRATAATAAIPTVAAVPPTAVAVACSVVA